MAAEQLFRLSDGGQDIKSGCYIAYDTEYFQRLGFELLADILLLLGLIVMISSALFCSQKVHI